MPFGTTVSTYKQKPNKSLLNYSSSYTPINPMANVRNSTISVNDLRNGITSVPREARHSAGSAPGMSAVRGGSNIPMPAMRSLNPNPIFQPTMSGNMRSGDDEGAYGVLGKIGEGAEIGNQTAQFKMDLANTIIRRRNAQAREQALYNQGFQSGGGGNTGSDVWSVTGGESFFNGDGAGSGLAPDQLANARMIADIGRRRGLNDSAIQIAIMTSLAESEMRNINYGDRDSLGLFQQRPSQGWGTPQQVTNPNYSINKFYDALQQTNWQRLNPWQAAQAVQRSFDPSGNNYRARYATAMQAYRAIQGQPVGGMLNYAGTYNKTGNAAAGFIQAYNNKYIDYDGAYGNQCVDLYNYYTAKFVGGKNIMVGWAPELYNAYDTRAYHRTGNNVPGAMGYVAIFRPGGSTPSGHVAIVVGDNGNGTLRVLHSNATSAGSRGNTIISNISKASLMGYLIPRRLMR